MDFVLDMYRQMCVSLKRGNTRGIYSNAKPIFLISLLDYFSLGKENRLLWKDSQLEAIYLDNFALLDGEKPTLLWKPFFYMSSEPFYSLKWKDKPPEDKLRFPSSKTLKEFLEYAQVDDQLWELLQDSANRKYLKNSILKTYFKNQITHPGNGNQI